MQTPSKHQTDKQTNNKTNNKQTCKHQANIKQTTNKQQTHAHERAARFNALDSKTNTRANQVVESVSVAVMYCHVVKTIGGHFGWNGKFRQVFAENASDGYLPRNCNVGVHFQTGCRHAESVLIFEFEIEGFEEWGLE
jgi:hypothetical protein